MTILYRSDDPQDFETRVAFTAIDRVTIREADDGDGVVDVWPEADEKGDYVEWSKLAPAFRAGRWWRVVAPDGSLWYETSSESEAREAQRPGDRLERSWVAELQEWRDASPLGDGPSYWSDVQPLEEELKLAADHPEYGIDVPAVEAALAEAKEDAKRHGRAD